jgi:DNA-binding HxlR family transcriptional regulator
MSSRLKRRKRDLDSDEMCPIVESIKTVVTESRLLVVRHLFTGPKGFNELWRESGINSKTLSLTLKFLERQRIVKREILSTRPFTVQYSLMPSGLELKPALEAFGNWGSKWLPEFNDNKAIRQHVAITQKIQTR